MVINSETIVSQKPREDKVSRTVLSSKFQGKDNKCTVKASHCFFFFFKCPLLFDSLIRKSLVSMERMISGW